MHQARIATLILLCFWMIDCRADVDASHSESDWAYYQFWDMKQGPNGLINKLAKEGAEKRSLYFRVKLQSNVNPVIIEEVYRSTPRTVAEFQYYENGELSMSTIIFGNKSGKKRVTRYDENRKTISSEIVNHSSNTN